MAAPPLPPEKPSIKREGFMIKDGVITCNGHERVESARLDKLFHPERAGGTHRTQKKYADEAKKLFSRAFFAGQLRFYGITYPRNATDAHLSTLLVQALAAHQCDQLPAHVVELQWELKLEFARELELWQKAAAEWDVTWKNWQEEQWAQLETPTERAGHDLTRFLEHYYLTDGVPDPAKKPEPLALYNFTDEQVIAELHERAAQVPGLEIVSAGLGPDSAICIGWNRASVYSLAGEIENVARENQKKRVEAEWEKAMQDHKRFAIQEEPEPTPILTPAVAAVAAAAAAEPDVPTPAALKLACGSFVLHCQAVAKKQAKSPHPELTKLALDIADIPATNVETLRANVELGTFHGTALLSFSQDILEWFVKRYDKAARDAAVDAAASSLLFSRGAGGKRKAEAYPEEEQQRPRKQPKIQEAKAGRIFLRMRGVIDDKGGKACVDVQYGYLDFLDGAWTKFKGVFDIPGVGNDIKVEGFRVAQEAAVEPPPWNEFFPRTVNV